MTTASYQRMPDSVAYIRPHMRRFSWMMMSVGYDKTLVKLFDLNEVCIAWTVDEEGGEWEGRGQQIRTVDGSHDESNLSGIRGTGEVGVDLFGLVLVQRHESVENVIACRGVVRTT